ncbi:MAG: hypothetical protein ACOH5I_00175 [Oligoflexus sp.]
MKHVYHRPTILIALWLASLIMKHNPSFAMQDESLKRLTNKGYSRDRYHPRLAPGLYVPSIQFGSGSDYDYETFNQIRLDYYHSQRGKYFLALPNFEAGQTTLGGEYFFQNRGKQRLWFGFQLRPQGLQLGPYARGIYFLSRKSKLHYMAEIMVGDARMLTVITAGFHSYPFASSKHSFIDIKARYVREHTEVSDERLKRSINAYSLSFDIGHGWARFADIKGLELYGAIGVGHSSLRHSTSDCIGQSCEFNDRDTEVRLLIGALFQYLPR